MTAAPLIRVWGGPSAGSYDETASRVAQSRDPLLCTAMVALWGEECRRMGGEVHRFFFVKAHGRPKFDDSH